MFRLKIISILFVGIMIMLSCGEDGGTQPQLSAPLALNAEDISQNSFTAQWIGVADAQGYILDVSTNVDFSTFIAGYEAKQLSKLSEVVSGLDGATQYYYRVRAYNNNVESPNSNVIKLTTAVPSDLVLKDAASDFFIGTIVQANRLTGQYDVVMQREFSSITAEYQMKMDIMYPNQGVYDWTASDAIVNYAVDNGFNLHGHALIWHNATPEWVRNFSGSDTEFEAMVKDYIKTVVGRYKGKVTSWDVVNEAFNDGSGSYRNSVFYQRLGEDYISKCFQWAREADQDVLLFYNDYNMCNDQTKQNAVFSMIDELISDGVSVNGVGFQMHISYNGPAKENIMAASNRIVERGLKVHFAELDIRANPDNNMSELTSVRALAQKEKYKEVAAIYNSLPASNKYALTIWGLKDDESWLLDFYGHQDWPLLFDMHFNKKDAYYGVLEGLLQK